MLTCTIEQVVPVTVLRLTGHLDHAFAPRVRIQLDGALAGQPTAIVVNLAEVTVADDVVHFFSAFALFATNWGGCPLLLCTPDAVLRHRLDRAGVGRVAFLRDDVAAALAAAGAIPPSPRIRTCLPATSGAAATARDVVRDACDEWGLPDIVEDAELVVTELVDNVVLHVGGTVDLLLTRREGFLHVAVHDDGHRRPERTLPDPGSGEGGRGLLLVEATAANWGAAEATDGKVVWASLPIVDPT